MSIAYFFRFIGPDGPTGWVGFALARDKEEIMWAIDEHGDPYSCEIQTTTAFSWCAKYGDGTDGLYEVHEIGDPYPVPNEGAWRKPPWVLRKLEEERVIKPKPEKFGYDKNAPF